MLFGETNASEFETGDHRPQGSETQRGGYRKPPRRAPRRILAARVTLDRATASGTSREMCCSRSSRSVPGFSFWGQPLSMMCRMIC
jgi:hypothetical protein